MSWMLDDLQEAIDVKEDAEKVTKIRKHLTIQIHKLEIATNPPNTLDLGDTKAAITYMVGGLTRTNNPPGSGRFLCVGDGITPHGNPSDYIYRRQTWEWFGAWTDAPSDWNQ